MKSIISDSDLVWLTRLPIHALAIYDDGEAIKSARTVGVLGDMAAMEAAERMLKGEIIAFVTHENSQ